MRALILNCTLKPAEGARQAAGARDPGDRHPNLARPDVEPRLLRVGAAIFSELDDQGSNWTLGKVAGIVVTGNEDGAHHIVGTVSQGLIDIGYTVPGQSWTYWHLGPGPGPNYTETAQAHDYSDRLARNAARNLLHAARALRAAGPFPAQEGSG